MRYINKFFILTLSTVLSACSANRQPVRPEIVPAVEVKKPVTHSLGIIGESEPIYFMPMTMPFQARIDTGAEMSSIDAKNIKKFERDGEKWVSFDLVNRKNGERHHFEKKIKKIVDIKRINEHEKRYAVEMDVKFGKEVITGVRFTLADREKFEYQALIGRNILTGRAIVDTALSNTLN